MSNHTFRITFSGSFSMTKEEIWPDGDAPAYPKSKDVIEKMRNSGNKSKLLDDWNLENDLDITVVDEKGNSEEWE